MRARRFMIPATAGALALCLAAPASAAATWTRQPVPLPGVATSGELRGVSCTSLTRCVAVGDIPGPTGYPQYTEVARWDGTAWSSREVPVPGTTHRGLVAVSCASADCIAVGSDTSHSSGGQPLALRWHGGRWSQQSLPVPSGTDASLNAVSCVSATSCTAVGSTSPGGSTVPLAVHWDGSSWTVQSTPSPAGAISVGFSGVSCVSDTNCTAVGSIFTSSSPIEPLAEHWDGSSWSRTSIAGPPGARYNDLLGVSCGSPVSCTAVGNYETSGGLFQPLAEHWDGSAWLIQPTPATSTNSELDAVSCPSATACTAAGDYPAAGRPLAEFWNGSTWERQRTAQPEVQSFLYGISCTAAHQCLAVGFGQAPTGFTPLLAEREQ